MGTLEHTNINESNFGNNTSMSSNVVVGYQETADLLQDAILIIDTARDVAYRAVNSAMVQRNWLLGHRIDVEILGGEERANYGENVIKNLSYNLTDRYGKGFEASNLYKFLQFYRLFPEMRVCQNKARP